MGRKKLAMSEPSSNDGPQKRKNSGSPFLSPAVSQPKNKVSNLRRSMITSTPVFHKHSAKLNVPKPMLSPIPGGKQGNEETLDFNISEEGTQRNKEAVDFSMSGTSFQTPHRRVVTESDTEQEPQDQDQHASDSENDTNTVPDSIRDSDEDGEDIVSSETINETINETMDLALSPDAKQDANTTEEEEAKASLDDTSSPVFLKRSAKLNVPNPTSTSFLNATQGNKENLDFSTKGTSFQTPRRRVFIESDSEDEPQHQDQHGSDSESDTNTAPIYDSDEEGEDIVASETINETIDLTQPRIAGGSSPTRDRESTSADDSEIQVLNSPDVRQHEDTEEEEEGDASLDDSIQVIKEVKPSPQALADIEKKRSDLETRLKSLRQMASTNLNALPDKGQRILRMLSDVENELSRLPPKLEKMKPEIIPVMSTNKGIDDSDASSKSSSSSRGPEVIPAPRMNSNDMERLVSADKGKRLFGGKMTGNRLDNVFRVTGDAIDKIYKSLTSAPENEEVDTPKGVKIPLMRHQKLGLAWMLWREKQIPPGGILADDMGLGKTLSMISLIMHQKNAREERERANDEEDLERKKDLMKVKIAKEKRLVPSNATLVIAPASLIMQWEDEIKRRVKTSKLNVLVFHGPKNKRETNPKRLAQHDVVITTYNLAAAELVSKDIIDDEAEGEQKGKRKFNDSSVLAQILWDRVILDEAHQIKNRTSNASRACCRVSAINRWCLTGTPIHNELWDLFSLIKFLRVTPFDEEKLWKEYIMTGRHGAERLNTLVKGLLIRRTKAQIDTETQKPLVDLKPRQFSEVEVVLEGLEMKVYQQMFLASQQQVKQLLKNQEDMERFGMLRRPKNGGPMTAVQNPFLFNSQNSIAKSRDNFQRMNCILVVLLKLRQACVHLALTKAHIDLDAFDTLGVENDPTADLNRELAEMSIAGDELINQVAASSGDVSEQVEALFEERYKSAKVKALLTELDKVLELGDKCVIVSQWTSMLNIVERHLKKREAPYTSITGAVPTKDRQSRVDSFNLPDGEGAQVMLLSLTAGGVGLNLIGGNHLFLLDLHWNPALENQACDRIYRMGQKKNVYIHKFICKDTIEQRVLELQKKKLELAHGVLDGAASKKLTKLNINDLKFLFDLNKPTEPAKNGPSTSARQPNNVPSAASARPGPITSFARPPY